MLICQYCGESAVRGHECEAEQEARTLTPAERAERLLESARKQREHERALARDAGWI